MIEEHGVVVAVDPHGIWLETTRKTACQGCNARKGCGQYLGESLSRSGRRRHVIRLEPYHALSLGDRVVIGIGAGTLLRASLLMYLLPLLFLMVSLWLASFLALSDSLSLLAAAGGLFSGLILVRHLSGQVQGAGDIRVLEVMPAQQAGDVAAIRWC